MENIYLPGTKSTPLINFNSSTGVFEITGRSIHENPVLFYQPLLEWLQNYSKVCAPHTTLLVNLEYFNTTSSKCLLDIFKEIKQIALSTGNTISIKWQYHPDDEDLKEAGEDYQNILEIPFEFIEAE
jgi:hypothetical protein